MRLEERKIAVRDLIVGMYVCRLDREWKGTPFPLQGLHIDGQEGIDALAGYCEYVYIDIELGLAPRDAPLLTLERRQHRFTASTLEGLPRRQVYRDIETFAEEVPRARQAQQRIAALAGRILEDVRSGRSLSIDEIQATIEPMVRSVIRNMDAFLWIESMRKRDAYDYSHALNCSALAAAFGRHLGFPEDVLLDLATGGLLLDVGKAKVPGDMLQRAGPLQADEVAQMQCHVEHALALFEEGAIVSVNIHDMIRTHHERNDGSGYPDRLAGKQIPLLGRIAAVIDSYDAMTSKRVHRDAISRQDALQEIYRQRDSLYAAEIVEQFMQCLGIYPTGSLVELSDGRVAVIMAQNPARRLFPRIMVLTAPDKQVDTDFRFLDLMRQPDGSNVRISRVLEPGAYGLDPTKLYL